MADRTDRVELSWCDGVFHPPVTVPTYDVELAEYITDHCGPRHKRFYDSARWLHLRARVIADAHGASLYELAQSPSRYVPATVVHHVMRVDDYPGWALSEWAVDERGRVIRNLVPLSHLGHDVAHGRFQPHGSHAPHAPMLTVERW